MTTPNNSYPRSYFGNEPEIVVPATNEDKQTATRTKRKTTRQTAQAKAQKAKLALYSRQESKRASKVQVDQGLVLWTWIVGIVIAFFASAVVSFNGITAVAQYVGLSAPWMATLFFFFIELMYVLFLIAYLAGPLLAGAVAGVYIRYFAVHVTPPNEATQGNPFLQRATIKKGN